jgi:anti-anti-sigma factor
VLDYSPQLQVVNGNGVAVIHFPRTDMSEEAAQAVGRQLCALAEAPRSRRLVLDLGDVRCLSSAMLGKLIGFDKRVKQRGGELALCSPSPVVAAQFERMRLDKLFHICATEEEALADWGGSPLPCASVVSYPSRGK